jgi:tetratricopeptide (TPR) repeat protein
VSLAQIFEGYRDTVRDFYDDDRASLLVVSAAPEAESVAIKLVASVDSEPLRDEVSFAYSGPFANPSGYYQAAAQSILANIAADEEALRREQIEIEPPAPLDLQAGFPIEVAFADFVERCSRALAAKLAKRTVVVLHAEGGDSGSGESGEFITSALSLGSLAAARRTKFVAFTSPAMRLGDSGPSPRRLQAAAPADERERASVLEVFFANTSSRVLVWRPGHGSTAALAEIQRAALRVGVTASMLHVSLEPAPLRDLAAVAMEALSARKDAASLREQRPDRHRLEPIDYLAQLCEDWAHSLGTVGGRCIVVLSLAGWGHDDLDRARELVSALNLAACSPRVRYVILDGTAAGVLPVLTEAPRRVATLRIAPDTADMEAGLQAQLKEPNLPTAERIRCLDGLATLARTRKQHDVALSLHDEALVLARESDDPAALFLVWHGIGQSFHHAENWESAENAFSKALSICLDAKLTPGVAQSMLSLANALFCAEKLEDAELCYRSAIDWYDKLGGPLFACHAMTWLGETERRLKQLDGAVQTWDRTYERYCQLGDDFRDAVLEGKKQVLGRLIRVHEERNDAHSAALCRGVLAKLGSAPVLTDRP